MNRFLREKLARLEFWWATKTLKPDVDFSTEVVDNGLGVTILKGKYAGVKLVYTNMVIREEDDVNGCLDFETHVVENPNNEDVTSKKFVKLATNILRYILKTSIEKVKNYEKEMVNNEEGKTDSVQPNEEREFHEEDTSVLERRVSKRKPRKKAVSGDKESHSKVQQPAKRSRAKTGTGRKKRPDGK